MDVCTISTFLENYDIVHKFYNQCRVQLAGVEPNAAHYKIAELCQRDDLHVINITANVTDLLERAGVPDVIHVHGEITKIHTKYKTNESETIDIGYTEWDAGNKDDKLNLSKPAVVFFGEEAPRYEDMFWEFNDLREGDVVVGVGTTFCVNPIHMMLPNGVKFIVINPERLDVDRMDDIDDAICRADVHICEPATIGLSLLEQQL